MSSQFRNKNHSNSDSDSEEEKKRKDFEERAEFSNHLKVKDECETRKFDHAAGCSAGETDESLLVATDEPKDMFVPEDEDPVEDEAKTVESKPITIADTQKSSSILSSAKDFAQATKAHQIRRARTNSEIEELMDWIQNQKNKKVKASLEEDSSLRQSVNGSGRTLLHISASSGNDTATYYVLDIFDVDARDSNGRTALMHAIEHNHAKVVEMLLSAGCDIDVLDNEGKDVLHLGFAKKDLSKTILVLLLRELRKRYANDEVIAEKLIDSGFQMYQAACTRDVALVKSMLTRGVNIDATDLSRRTALHIAVILEEPEIAKLLLDNGADAEALDIDEMSPLLYNYTCPQAPGNRKKLAILELLLARKVALTKTVGNGALQVSTTLMFGCAEAIARVLRAGYLDFGAADESTGSHPMHYLASNCNRGVAHQLKLHASGQDYHLNATDKLGFVALHTAVRHGNVEMLQFLLENGADANHPLVGLNTLKFTPIYLLCIEEQVPMAPECLEILLQHKADPQASVTYHSGKGITLLDFPLNRSKMKLVVASLVMIQRQGEPIVVSISKKINSSVKLRKYYNRCQSVLDMKVLGSISIFKLLTDNDKKMMGYFNDAELRLKLKKLNYKLRLQHSFSYYLNILRKRIVKLWRLKGLRAEAAGIVCKWFENPLDEKHIVTERILDFLDILSLEQLISL